MFAITGRVISKFISYSAIQKSKNIDFHLAVLKELPEIIKKTSKQRFILITIGISLEKEISL